MSGAKLECGKGLLSVVFAFPVLRVSIPFVGGMAVAGRPCSNAVFLLISAKPQQR